MPRILIVDDEPLILKVLSMRLMVEGYDVVPMQDSTSAVKVLAAEVFDLVLTDLRMPAVTGMEILRLSREKVPELPVIIITAYASASTAAEALKLGVFDYVPKPFKIEQLMTTIKRALDYRASLLLRHGGGAADAPPATEVGRLIATNPEMKEACAMIRRVAGTDARVFIQGEYGTGKQTAARTIHDESVRAQAPFAVIPCGELPEPILEAELFGDIAGGSPFLAPGQKPLVETAAAGSVYLQDIDALPTGIQRRLLDVLLARRAVDGTPLPRFIAGSAAIMSELVEKGLFLKPLYMEFASLSITIPPLRRRPDDILLLANHFLRSRAAPSATEVLRLHPELEAALKQYDWPGNVSELAHAIDHAAQTAPGPELCQEHLPEYLVEAMRASPAARRNEHFHGEALRAFLTSRIQKIQPSAKKP